MEKEKNGRIKKLALTGGAASAEALRQINPDVMPVYPITPQTPIIASFAKYQSKRKVDTELITVESEHSAMSAAIGASASGARTVTATSSQGLALMNEMVYIAGGMQLPILMLVSARALSAPINIHCDHSDVMSVRDAGWVQIFSEDAQEVYDNTLLGMKLAESGKTPVMVIMDGFITSHSVTQFSVLSDEAVRNFVGEYQPEDSLLNFEKPVSYGALALPNSYFEFKLDQDEILRKISGEYRKVAHAFGEISGRFYDYFESYALEDAESVIVAAGSVSGTIKEAVDKLRLQGEKVGLLKIKMFRPFPHEDLAHHLEGARRIAVLDRAMSFGTYPPLYNEVLAGLYGSFGNDKKVFLNSYVYGLGGREIFKKDIEKVFAEMKKNEDFGKIKYLGVN